MNGKQLKNSILQWAIQGKLVPQDANDEPAIELLKRLNPKIKPITEDVPFEVPESWVWTSIKDIGNIVTGSTPPKANKEHYEGNIPFFKPTDLEQGRNVCFSRDHLSQLGFEISRQLPPNSILVTCIGATIGKTGMTSIEGTCNQQINAIIPYKEIFPPYVYYACNSEFFQCKIKDNASATTLPILNKNKFGNLIFPLPPLAEQKRIVARIEELMPLVERYTKAQEGLDKLNEGIKGKLRASILQEAIQGKLVPQDASEEPAIELLKRFNPKIKPITDEVPFEVPESWVWVRLGDVGKWQSGATPSRQRKDYYGGDIPWIKTGDLKDGLIVDVPENITQKALDETSVKLNPAGSVLMAMYAGISIGKLGILISPATTNQACCACVEYKGITQLYLFYFLLANRKNFVSMAKGSAQHNISKEKIVATPIPIPPLAEQKRIVAKIEELFGVLDRL